MWSRLKQVISAAPGLKQARAVAEVIDAVVETDSERQVAAALKARVLQQPGLARSFSARPLQGWWRPCVAFGAVACALKITIVAGHLAFSDAEALGVYIQFITALSPILLGMLAVSGVSAIGRSVEKATGRD